MSKYGNTEQQDGENKKFDEVKKAALAGIKKYLTSTRGVSIFGSKGSVRSVSVDRIVVRASDGDKIELIVSIIY